MNNLQIIQESPLSDELISAGAFIGYLLKLTSEKIKGLEPAFGFHLVHGTADRMLRIPPESAENVFESRFILFYDEPSSFGELAGWFFAKFQMRRKKVNPNERPNFAQLNEMYISEKQAIGYMIFAADDLDFLNSQIKVFEMEIHLMLRTISTQEALKAFYTFVGSSIE